MAYPVPATQDSFGRTRRTDAWWVTPTAILLSFVAFIGYSTWAAFQPRELAHFGPYTSPFFSPDLTRLIPGFKWSRPC